MRTRSSGGASPPLRPGSAHSSPGAASCRGSPAAGRVALALLAVATLALIGNYVLYLVALDHVTPSVTQVVIQLAPLLLLVGGVLMFREPFRRMQWAGFAVLVAGLLLFFNERLPRARAPSRGARPRRRADGGGRRVLGGLRPRAEEAAREFFLAAGAVDHLRRRRRR